MTAHHPRSVWALPAEAAARFHVGLAPRPIVQPLDPRLDVTVALRRCATYRKALRAGAISYPAGILWMEPVADWVKRHGASVDVTSADELELTVAEGISPPRLVMHCADATARPIRLAVNAGVGRFLVHSDRQIALLASCAQRPQRLLVDVTARPADVLAGAIMARQRLDLIGLHRRLGAAGRDAAGDSVQEMIAQMSWIRSKHDVILTRVSLAEFHAAEVGCDRSYLRVVSEDLDEAIDDACARYRYPRPALVVAMSQSALSPTV
jgi:diaminopimelate decarboxylase